MPSIYNFSAGPSLLPKAVMEQVQGEWLDWHNTGLSVVEMSHRSAAYESIIQSAEHDLRTLMAIPSNYAVLFMQGGGVGQFDAVPLNLRPEGSSADYLITGQWSEKALTMAQRTGQARCIATTKKAGKFLDLPQSSDLVTDANAAYLHFCSNETVNGIEWEEDDLFSTLPRHAPWVADMSSTILSRPIDVSRYGAIYAGAQKNIGPAGLTVVIIDRALLGKASIYTPDVMNYTKLDVNGSMYNTPPTFAIYMAGLVFKWILQQGGVEAMARLNAEKAALLYAALDASSVFSCPVAKRARSRMNIPFSTGDAERDREFVAFADQRGLVQLKGHKTVGGMRASLYNAMPIEGVHALISALNDFETQIGKNAA